MKKVYKFMGGRKLLFAVILAVIASVFVWFNKCTASEWMEFMKWTFGIYASTNVGEHVTTVLKERK